MFNPAAAHIVTSQKTAHIVTHRKTAHVQTPVPHPPAVAQMVNGKTPLAAAPMMGVSRTMQTPAPRVADNDKDAGAGGIGGSM